MGLGKKYYDLDTPFSPNRVSTAGSGIMVLIPGTEISNPKLNITLSVFITQLNNSPSFDAPSLVWS